jgi:hypothetical protein
VWQILLHRHPVHVEHPASSAGRIDRGTLAQFCESIADYPDFLQDALLLIAHAKGFATAMVALDEAIRDHLAAAPAPAPTPAPVGAASAATATHPTRNRA